MLGTNWTCLCTVIISTASVSFGQAIDKILGASDDSRVAMIVEELNASATATTHKVIDAQWSYSGKFDEGSYGELTLSKHRTSGKLHLIMGHEMFWSKYDYPFITPEYDSRVDTYQAGKTHYYKFKNSKITYVDIMCDFPLVLEDMKFYCDLTYFAPWREGKQILTPRNFHSLLSSCRWAGSTTSESGGSRVISIANSRPPIRERPRASSETTYHFSEIERQLALVGTTTRLVRPQNFNGDEYDIINEFVSTIKYRYIDGLLLPSGYHTVILSRSSNPDGTPYKTFKPIESKNVTWTLQNVRLLDRFPVKMLDISVPATARIADHCRNQRERAERKQIANSGWTRGHWLFVGVMLCFAGCVLLWLRQRTK